MVKTARPKVSASKRPRKMRKKSSQARFAQNIGAVGHMKRPERKNTDTLQTLSLATGVSTWSPVAMLSLVGQGANQNQRIGRKVVLTKCSVRWHYKLTGGSVVGAPFRIMVVYDKNPNGVLPTPSIILNADDINGHVNLAHGDRFMILKDYYPLKEQQYTPTVSLRGYCDKFTLNFGRGLESTYEGTGAVISDCQVGCIYLLFCTTSDATATTSELTFRSRVRYTDV